MSFRGHEVLDFERQMKKVFDRIDHELEDRYGGTWPLHPARPPHGSAPNPEHTGLFRLGASFSPGYGSAHGRGYVMDIRMVTLAQVPQEVQNEVRRYVAERSMELLPDYFPERELSVVRDGDTFKIIGDLSLGKAGATTTPGEKG